MTVGAPIWRADLLESVEGRAGSFDRTHYHPSFIDWNPSQRVFDQDLSDDPIGWLTRNLSDLPALLRRANVDEHAVGALDMIDLPAAVPQIVDAVRRLLAKVRAGELGRRPDGDWPQGIRASWL